ncbi:hypothetical protein AD11_4957 [Escherichia coli 1-250-04_S4_C2]|nr:hypothetical protein AD11_4957 [Escherichia coli 1-250-04_S4_C2]
MLKSMKSKTISCFIKLLLFFVEKSNWLVTAILIASDTLDIKMKMN